MSLIKQNPKIYHEESLKKVCKEVLEFFRLLTLRTKKSKVKVLSLSKFSRYLVIVKNMTLNMPNLQRNQDMEKRFFSQKVSLFFWCVSAKSLSSFEVLFIFFCIFSSFF